jgi:transposase
MGRRKFTREFKLEAVRLIKERGVSYTQASMGLGVHQKQRSWLKPTGLGRRSVRMAFAVRPQGTE